MEFERDYGRYLVIKRSDCKRYLSDLEQERLTQLLGRINDGRVSEGKAPYHSYICVRQDAWYAESVWNLIQADIEAREAPNE